MDSARKIHLSDFVLVSDEVSPSNRSLFMGVAQTLLDRETLNELQGNWMKDYIKTIASMCNEESRQLTTPLDAVLRRVMLSDFVKIKGGLTATECLKFAERASTLVDRNKLSSDDKRWLEDYMQQVHQTTAKPTFVSKTSPAQLASSQAASQELGGDVDEELARSRQLSPASFDAIAGWTPSGSTVLERVQTSIRTSPVSCRPKIRLESPRAESPLLRSTG